MEAVMVGARVELDRKALKGLSQKAGEAACRKASRITMMRVRQNIVAAGRVNTGAMVRSVHVERISPTLYRVTSDSPYIGFQEYGTSPYVIRPKRKGGVLSFEWPKAGGRVAFKSVRHPGIPAGNFFKRAMNELSLRDFLP